MRYGAQMEEPAEERPPGPEDSGLGLEASGAEGLGGFFVKPAAAALPGVGAGGTSGHSNSRRFRFAFAAYGPFAASLVIFFAKDMYVLKLGANTERVGIIATAWSALFPIFYPLAGHLMDREPPLLALPGWGRRAPWFLSHLVPLALCVALIYLPCLGWTPAPGSWVLEAWLGIFLFLAGWCLAVLLDTFESARAEIYPFSEERALVEAMTKLVGGFAATTGIIPQLLLWMVFTMTARVTCSLGLLVCVLLSLEAVPVLRDARQPRSDHAKPSFRECMEVLQRAPMAHATALRFWYAACDTATMNFSVYYLAFTDGLCSAERTQWMFLCGLIVAFVDLLFLTPLWGIAWSGSHVGSEKRLAALIQRVVPPMRTTCLVFHILAAIIPSLILQLLPRIMTGVRPWEWIVFTVAQRILLSPQTFFRMNSFCWAVDEDCHLGQGRRREAVHAGVIKLFEDEGRTLAFLLFTGLGMAGMQTNNCELECEGQVERAACVEACDRADILRQPPAVSEYVVAVLTYAAPCFSILCALHIWLYPIHGERLETLQGTQAIAFKNVTAAQRTAPLDPPVTLSTSVLPVA